MTEYKDTLNLPKTEFPMKASLATREPDWINAWEESKLYQKIRQKRAGAKQFILHDGPPYANGHLHCGHAFNKILKDIIIKSKTLAGYDAPYVPGWDCHGLPIELNVEKKYGKAGVKLSAREFRQKCREYAASQIDIQRQEFKRFGVLGDWQNPYITMDFAYEANIIRALAKIVRNNHLQQGFKPVHWCLDCASALAEAEVEYENKTSPAIDVAFNVVDTAAFAQRLSVTLTTAPIAVPIWTTTPWTLPANQAVALNAELTYVLLLDKQANRYLLVAEGLKEQVLARYGVSDETIVATVQGALLEGLRLQHPLFDNKHVPIVLADHVSLEAGTGCVHTAPAHGPDDYKVGLQYQLPLENPVMANGCYADSVTGFAGLYVAKADERIIDALRANDCLLHAEKINHSYPHCWRHKTPIIFRATPQWFISMDKAQLRTKSMQAIKETQFIPDWGQARIAGMVEQRPDWCISRQRAWGVPIPLFVHKQTGELHPETDALMEEIANRVEKEGIDAWFELAPETLLGESAAEYDKVMDTLDVWFDSGVSHFSVLEQRPGLAWPADLYLEGSDQHRGWFNSSLMTACAINGTAPYKTILTHGFTVDAEGKKMSKSKGNYIAPEKLIQQSGADILRLWVASTDYRGDVHLSDEIIKRTSDAYRRIRNTCRFLLANLFDFDYAKHAVAVEQMVELDKWAIKQAQLLQEAVVSAYDSYDFHTIYQKIHNFCAVEMGSFYLDIIKDRQYTAATESVARRSCQTAMYHIIEALVRLMAPILSFTANEVWRYLPGSRDEAVFLSEWYQGFPAVGAVDLAKWQRLRLVRDEVNKAIEQKRKTKELGAALEAEVSLYANALYYQDLMQLQDELRFLLITSSATVQSLSEATSGEGVATDLPELKLNITASEAPKCGRCWHRIADVGRIAEHPALCGRCVGNVSGAPEERQYA